MLDEQKRAHRPLYVGWAMPAPGPVRSAWEYLTLETSIQSEIERVTATSGDATLHDLTLPVALAMLGAADWELVSATPRGESHLLYTFKRPAQQ